MEKKLNAADRELILSLYNSYERLLKNTIIRCLGEEHHQEVEDILMDVVYISCCKVEQLKKAPNPAGWLVNTAKNVCRNYVRRKVTEQKYTDGASEDVNIHGESFETALVNDMAFEEWMEQDAVGAIKRLLSPKELMLYELRFVEKRTISEISAMQKRSEGSVKVAVCRLKKHIVEIVQDRGFENLKKGGSKNEKR